MPNEQPPATVESNETLREGLLALRRQNAVLQENANHSQLLLSAFDALLTLDSNEDPVEHVVESLRKVFSFWRAMIFSERAPGDTELDCILAEPKSLVGTRWPVGPVFRKALNGRAMAVFSHAGTPEGKTAASFGLDPASPGLYVPMRTHDRRGLLLLLPAPGTGGYNRSDVELAQRFTVLMSHAMGQRVANQVSAESRRLLEINAQLQRSEQAARANALAAQRNADLLQEIMQMLPVGVMVQDAVGKLMMANDTAQKLFWHKSEGSHEWVPRGQSAQAVGAYERRHNNFQEQMQSDAEHTIEQAIEIDGATHMLLVTGKPVHIFDEHLMLTASLDITKRKHAEEELQHRVFYDALTGLPSRALIQEIVENTLHRYRKSGALFSVAFINLDNFKQINDFYGHAAGDQLLVAVGKRIADTMRVTDTLARVSDDEFLLLIDPLENQSELDGLLDGLLEALRQPFPIAPHQIMTSATIGVSLHPLHGVSYEALYSNADSALYRAKTARKGGVMYFDQSMGSELTARMGLEQRLRVAVSENRFRPAYQPKVDLRTGKVLGFEALARWVEPNGEIIMPDKFIKLACDLGLINDIEMYMLDQVARDLPLLNQHFGAHIGLNMNVSALEAGDVKFMRRFIARLDELGIARQFMMELTEDALVSAYTFQSEVLPQLRALGARVSIDDFGTGYSSLSVLSQISADELKIDRAFITRIDQRPGNQSILRAIDLMCNTLGIATVAEGPDRAEEIDYLRNNTSITCIQGFYFSKPWFIEELAAGCFHGGIA